MTFLFLQTLGIQLVVGLAFLLLGLWGGKFLWGHDRPHGRPQPDTGADADTPESGAAPVAAGLDDEIARLRMLNGKLRRENQSLRADAAAADVPPSGATAKAGGKAKTAGVGDEELTRIRGIGKVMAEQLRKRDVRTFRQIAEWTRDDIAKLPFGSRVRRDKWQLQARRLHKEKFGDKP